jgi:8-oxo-dGTP pyrophosphatase MutT (NUDIX family)
MLVRDRPGGLEVFMLRRNPGSDFAGGAYVFPGGAVDEADKSAGVESVCDGRSDAEASGVLSMPSGGLAYWVAAVRECFEEAGVLLARHDVHEGGDVVSFAEPVVARRFARHRDAVYRGTTSLVELCRMERLRLDTSRIHYVSHWITPRAAPKRYDTRFFVASAPSEQVPLHDDGETIAHLWITPHEALERCERGELEMILPTIRNLEAIGRFEQTRDLLDVISAMEPGDARYDGPLL